MWDELGGGGGVLVLQGSAEQLAWCECILERRCHCWSLFFETINDQSVIHEKCISNTRKINKSHFHLGAYRGGKNPCCGASDYSPLSITDINTHTFYLELLLMCFHVGESSIFIYWSKITPGCSFCFLSAVISGCISRHQNMRLPDCRSRRSWEPSGAGGAKWAASAWTRLSFFFLCNRGKLATTEGPGRTETKVSLVL